MFLKSVQYVLVKLIALCCSHSGLHAELGTRILYVTVHIILSLRMLNLKFYKSLIGDSKSWKPNLAQPTLGALTGIPIPFLNLEFERQNLCSLMQGNYSEIVPDTYPGCAVELGIHCMHSLQLQVCRT